MLQVYAIKLDKPLDKSRFERLLSYVSTEKREKISRFHKFDDAQTTLIADILIRYLLCKELKIRNNLLKFGTNEYGKPFLINYKDIHFNISHSYKWVVCCISTNWVGIDIEKISPIDISIAEQFFSKIEFEELNSKNTFEKEVYFYDLWTLKESYIKAIGKGLSIPLDSFTLRIDKEDQITVSAINNSEHYYFRQYNIDEDYKMAVCSSKNEFPHYVNYINLIDLSNLDKEAWL